MGLDLSYTQTGVCVWDGVQAYPHSVCSDKKKGNIERAQEIRAGIWRLLPRYGPLLFVIEAPLVHAPRAEILTGLFFLVVDRLLHLMEMGTWPIRGIVALPNPSMRKLMGVKQGRGSKENTTKAEFKKQIVAQARKTIGSEAPDLSHDEADAFFLAYYGRRFWVDWKGEGEDLSEAERDVWYSEGPKSKKVKRPQKKVKKPQKKGIIYRQGEFLFLPSERRH